MSWCTTMDVRRLNTLVDVRPPPERVAIDATLADEPTTGIGLYVRCLSRALEQAGVQVVRYGATRSGDEPRGRMGKTAFVVGKLPALLASRGERLFHAVGNFNLPWTRPRGTRLVLTVHDLIPELFPETVSTRFRWQFRLWLTRSLALADHVICVSETTRADLAARYDYPIERTSVVHLGVDHLQGTGAVDAEGDAFLRELALPRQFILYAGSLDARKNLGLVFDACERLHARGRSTPLVLVGQRWFGSSTFERRMAELQQRGVDVRWVGFQPDALLYELMRRATVFVFPSRYEGFGLPPLEAMSLGIPTVVGDAGALPEVCGDGAVKVPVDDAAALADAVERLLGSELAREELARRGRARAASFTWAKAAEGTLRAYQAVFLGRES